jgi:hypothetical protein
MESTAFFDFAATGFSGLTEEGAELARAPYARKRERKGGRRKTSWTYLFCQPEFRLADADVYVLTPPAAPKNANRTRSTRSRSRSSLEGNIIRDGTGKGTHYCSTDEESIYADANADEYSTAALVMQAA